MRLMFAGAAALLALAATPSLAQDEVYQVLRPGDRDMSCEALGAEANTLNAALATAAAKSQRGAGAKQFGRSVAGGVTGGAMKVGGRMMLGRVIGGMTPFGGLVAVAANDAMADATGQAIASGPSETAPAVVAPEQQRMNHLLGLYREKGC